MAPEISAALVLSGNFDPKQIAIEIGLEPTKVWTEGEHIQGTILRRKESGFVIEISKESSFEIESQIRKLFDTLMPRKEAILNLCHRLGITPEISCAIFFSEEFPSIHLSWETLNEMGSYKSEFDIDVIALGGPLCQRPDSR